MASRGDVTGGMGRKRKARAEETDEVNSGDDSDSENDGEDERESDEGDDEDDLEGFPTATTGKSKGNSVLIHPVMTLRMSMIWCTNLDSLTQVPLALCSFRDVKEAHRGEHG